MINRKYNIKKEISKVKEEVENIATSEIEENIIEAKFFINRDKYMFVNHFSIIVSIAALLAVYASLFGDDNKYLEIAVFLSAAFVYGAAFWVVIQSKKSFSVREIAEYKIGLLQKRIDLNTEVKINTESTDCSLTIEERFENAGIPICKIERELGDLIDVLNFRLGLHTIFSCYGHENGEKAFIVIDSSVTDERILHLVEYLSRQKFNLEWSKFIIPYDYGTFNKWIRNEDGLLVNWVYEYPTICSPDVPVMYEALKYQHTCQLIQHLHNYADEYSVKDS